MVTKIAFGAEPFLDELVGCIMTHPINQQLVHALQGNAHLAQGLAMRFAENAPVLMQIFHSAWERGDADAIHGSSFRLLSHLRVMGLEEEVQAMKHLNSKTPGEQALCDSLHWKVITQGVQSALK